MMFRKTLVVLFAGLLGACSVPLGTSVQPHASLVLRIDGLVSAGSGSRLVTPDTASVELSVSKPSGELLKKATVTWNASQSSASVNLTGIPLGQPLVFKAVAQAAPVNGVASVTGEGSATKTLTTGANVLPLFIFPVVDPDNVFDFNDTSGDFTLGAGSWSLWKFTVPAGEAAFSVYFTPGVSVYLQAPSGSVVPLYISNSSVAAQAGSWTALVWNRETVSIDTPISVETNSVPDYDYSLDSLTIDRVAAGDQLEIRLFDRPASFSGRQLVDSRAFSIGAAGSFFAALPHWTVTSQMSLEGYNALEDVSIPIKIPRQPTGPGTTRNLFGYMAQTNGQASWNGASPGFAPPSAGVKPTTPTRVLMSFDGPLPAPQGFSVNATTPFTATWSTINSTDYSTIRYEIETSADDELITLSNVGDPFTLPAGPNTLRIRGVFDGYGYTFSGEYSTAVTLTVPDTELPEILVYTPSAGGYYQYNRMLVTGGTSDNLPLPAAPPTARYRRNLGAWSSYSAVDTYDKTTGDWTFALDNLQGSLGDYDLQVTFKDAAGNESSQGFLVTIEADNAGPTIEISGLNGATVFKSNFPSNLLPILASFSDNGGIVEIAFAIDGGAFGYGSYGQIDYDNATHLTGLWKNMLDISALGGGMTPHTLTVRATDAQGNFSDSMATFYLN